MKLARSVLAVGGALAAALAVQLVLGGAVKLAAPALAGLSGRGMSAALVIAYLLGTIPCAVAAGITLGRLAPAKPSLHVCAVGLLSPLIGYVLAGQAALPHGWQIVGYGVQLMFIEFVTLRVFDAQMRPPKSLSARTA